MTKTGRGARVVTRRDFAEALLEKLELRANKERVLPLVAWMSAENTLARYNPLATTREMPGSKDFGSQTSQPVQHYVDFAQGVEATHLTLTNGLYRDILRLLGLGAKAHRVLEAVAGSEWGTGQLAADILPTVEKKYRTYASEPIGQD